MSSGSPACTYYTFTNCSINNSSFHITINNSGSGTSTADANDDFAAADTASSSTTTAAAANVAADTDTNSKSSLRRPKRAAADLIPDTNVSSLY